MSDPVELFVRLQQSLGNDAELDEEVKSWLHSAFSRYMAQTEKPIRPIDEFLGLSGESGRVTVATALQKLRRDAMLKEAARLLSQELVCCGPYTLAGHLLDKLIRFQSIKWRRIQSGDTKPADPLEELLVEVLKTSDRIPMSQTGIYNILK